MRKFFLYFIIIYSVFLCAPRLWAWSDEVEGVLMPAPRGGAGITGEEAEDNMYAEENNIETNTQTQVEWE
jgi:hypothetical protein